ncbi:MAG: tryptophan synthase subunit beta, partial [Thermodesulfobacteriota bacterium]
MTSRNHTFPPITGYPDAAGHFGRYGGMYIAETLMPAVLELDEKRRQIMPDPAFQKELRELLADYVGRPTPLFFAKRLTAHLGGAAIYLKREDLAHT